MKNRAMFLLWPIAFLLSRIFPSAPEDVGLAVIGTALAIGLGVASAAGSVASGVLAAKGAGKQARAAERATEVGVAEERRQFDITQQNLAPWLGAGTAAVQRLQFLLGLSGQPTGQPAVGGFPGGFDSADLRDGDRFGRLSRFADEDGFDFDPTRFRSAAAPGGGPEETDPEFGSLMQDFGLEDFETEPGYEFRLAEGAKALERSAAARGQSFSGGTLKALTRYSQGVASDEFGRAYGRFQENRMTRYNFLAGLSGTGQATGVQLGDIGARTASDIAGIQIGGITSAAAARASGYSALGQSIGQGVNTSLNWLALSRLAQRKPGPEDVREFFMG
jgi:hypothetical protein